MNNRDSWVKFSTLFKIPLRNGLTKPSKIRGEGFKMVNMGELFAYSRISDIPMERVPLSTKEISTYLLKEGDLLFARQSLTVQGAGKCSIVLHLGEPTTYEGHLIRVRLDSQKCNPLYYYYFFNSPIGRLQVETIIEQVAAAGIRASDLANLRVPFPLLDEQNEIANLLNQFDDKIDINNRMNQTLEKIAQTIFKSWFVDFDPVRAKAGGRDTGLPAEIADLFPDSFEESEVGQIPSGWEIKPLDAVATFLNGVASQKYPATNGEEFFPVIKIAELRRGITDASDRSSKKVRQEYIVHDGDVLFSWSGSLEVCLWTGGDGLLNQHLFKVFSAEYPKWFYYYWVLHYLPKFRAIAFDKATTMGHIQRFHITNSKVVIPHAKALRVIDNLLSPILERIISNGRECLILEKLRDGIIQELMNEK